MITKTEYEAMMQVLDRLDRQLQAARSIPMEDFHAITPYWEPNFTFRIGDFTILDGSQFSSLQSEKTSIPFSYTRPCVKSIGQGCAVEPE